MTPAEHYEAERLLDVWQSKRQGPEVEQAVVLTAAQAHATLATCPWGVPDTAAIGAAQQRRRMAQARFSSTPVDVDDMPPLDAGPSGPTVSEDPAPACTCTGPVVDVYAHPWSRPNPGCPIHGEAS